MPSLPAQAQDKLIELVGPDPETALVIAELGVDQEDLRSGQHVPAQPQRDAGRLIRHWPTVAGPDVINSSIRNLIIDNS